MTSPEKLYLVYHDPGDPRGIDLIDEIARRVEKLSGVKVYNIKISVVEELDTPFEENSMVYALLAFRGGHLATTIEKAYASRACYIGKLPVELIARGISKQLRGCDSILIVYRKAKRFTEEQSQDLKILSEQLSKLTGARVRISHVINSDDSDQCIVVTTLMPGRISTKALEAYDNRVKIPHLLPTITEDIILDILERIRYGCVSR
ncbi:MAG: hypothetical protein F7C81_05255 [Desulfurococcales archaeon]|nr:hypothetical protein [Desulfurococcales archaeon]